jgi:hypothetical protein
MIGLRVRLKPDLHDSLPSRQYSPGERNDHHGRMTGRFEVVAEIRGGSRVDLGHQRAGLRERFKNSSTAALNSPGFSMFTM